MPYEILRIIGQLRVGTTTKKIRTTNDLLEATNNPKKRKEASAKTGIGEERLLELANFCALMRIKHLGPVYVILLRACGVHTVVELKDRNSTRLYESMRGKNLELRLAKTVPHEKTIDAWKIAAIEQGRSIFY